jgi:hypothetical protein
MLIHVSKLDTDNRVNCYLAGWIALDPNTGAHLRRSAGRRKAGKPAKYYLSTPGNDALMILASSDQEAINKANMTTEGKA